jgi:SPOR domain/Protein of unknown function (DUF1302)
MALRMGKRFWLSLLLAVGVWSISHSVWADYWIQTATYTKSFYAKKMVQTLISAGFSAGSRNVTNSNNQTLIQILVGPYSTRSAANEDLARLKEIGQVRDGYVRQYDKDILVKDQSVPAQKAGNTPPLSPGPTETKAAPPELPLQPVPTTILKEQEKNPVPSNEKPPAEVVPAVPSPIPQAENTEDLFGLDAEKGSSTPHFTGFFQSELAYAITSPQHLSKFRNMLELGSEGDFSANTKWKVSGRIAYDAVFDLNHYYPTTVRDDSQLESSLRETYMDLSAGDWDFRLGRQQIIWGEMVGLFFADVVSAKDLREFVLPEFDILRIPQWAVRSEYFKGDFHGEAIWIPYPTYDNIGVPGSEFYPYPYLPPPGFGMAISGEHRPGGSLGDSNYGLRLSELINGWDLSAFFYSSMDTSPTFFRSVITIPAPMFVYSPDHKRIQQIGGTLSKGYVDTVLKIEMVYTRDRWFAVNQLSDLDGVVQKDALDSAVGLDYNLPHSSRVNFQIFQRWFPDHDSAMIAKRAESGASLLISSKFMDGDIEPQLLVIASLSRGDWMARPKILWTLSGNWRWVLGGDVFGGARTGLFGQYGDNDRIYTELRYIF